MGEDQCFGCGCQPCAGAEVKRWKAPDAEWRRRGGDWLDGEVLGYEEGDLEVERGELGGKEGHEAERWDLYDTWVT